MHSYSEFYCPQDVKDLRFSFEKLCEVFKCVFFINAKPKLTIAYEYFKKSLCSKQFSLLAQLQNIPKHVVVTFTNNYDSVIFKGINKSTFEKVLFKNHL